MTEKVTRTTGSTKSAVHHELKGLQTYDDLKGLMNFPVTESNWHDILIGPNPAQLSWANQKGQPIMIHTIGSGTFWVSVENLQPTDTTGEKFLLTGKARREGELTVHRYAAKYDFGALAGKNGRIAIHRHPMHVMDAKDHYSRLEPKKAQETVQQRSFVPKDDEDDPQRLWRAFSVCNAANNRWSRVT